MSGRRIYNLCGRIHLGPICVNGGRNEQAICEACGNDVSRADREQVQRSWNTVRDLLAKYKKAKHK